MGRDKSPKGKKKAKKAQKVVVKHPKRVAYGATWRRPIEKKNIDFGTNLIEFTNSFTWSTPVLLNGVAQGPGATQYIGRSLMLKKLNFRYVIRGYIGNNDPTGMYGAHLRLMIVYDRSVERNSAGTLAVPAVTDILTADDWGSFNNLGNSERFCVIYDKIKKLAPLVDDIAANGAVYNGSSTVMFKGNIKLNHLMQFVGTSNLIADIEKGAIYGMMAQDGGLNSSTTRSSQGYFRFRFVDS